jgi:hypothetical protein
MYCKVTRTRWSIFYVLFLALLAAPGASGQQGRGKSQPTTRVSTSLHENISPSLLSTTEGMAVIGAALESRNRGRSRLDCSHLVHAVYERAGFRYAYVSSSDLYAGIEEFQRVAYPQPGDLVVWPGHVGIVVNPSQNTFFSSLRSGIGVESYSAPYWKQRGTPRFYRYAKTEGRGNQESVAETDEPTPTTLDVSMNRSRTLSSIASKAAEINLPGEQAINTTKPKPDEVTQAVLDALSLGPEGLRESDVFKLSQPLTVFSRIDVKSVKIHGDQGQAQIRITMLASVEGGHANLKKRQETETWLLRRRDRKTWEVSLPQDEMFVSQEGSVRILAHQLDRLADSDDSAAGPHQKTELGQMLSLILSDQK